MSESTSTARRREFALEVVRRLRSSGFQALFAGGCVRDLLLDLEPSDFDVATDARPEQVRPLFRRICEVGVNFGVVRVIGPSEIGDVEVATFRSDGAYVDGRRPESVVFSSPAEDASRRDFTINGMFYDPIEDQVVDYVGGREDLQARVLRAIGDPEARFDEDKLRLLRAPRFAAKFGFAIERATESAIRSRAGEVERVAAERIAQELHKILVHPTRGSAVRLVADLDLLEPILPPVGELACDPDLWRGTLAAVAALPAQAGFPLAFAALTHNVGRRQGEEGHAERAETVAAALCRRLKLSNDETSKITWLVRRQDALRNAEALTGSRIKPLLASPMAEDLLSLHAAVGLAKDAAFGRRYLADPPDGPLDPPPLLGGRDLMATGLKPGPEFSRLLLELRRAQLDREIDSKDQALAWVETHRGAG